jgi:hypothetical protein
MNTLFIGPTTQPDNIGLTSRSYLEYIELSEKFKNQIVSRPIILDRGLVDPLLPPCKSHNRNLDQTEIFIQNLPLDMLVYNPKFSKNIIIPILDHKKNVNSIHKSILQKADKILCNNPIDSDKILSCGVDPKKVSLFRIPFSVNPDTKNKKLNIGIYNNMYKFYFIGEYKKNIDIVHKIIISFLSTFRTNNNICLILWVALTEPEKNRLFEYYENTKKKMKINSGIDQILFIQRPIDYAEIEILHNTGNTYLALNDNFYPFIDEQYASIYESNIISRSQLNSTTTPYYGDSDYYPSDTYEDICIDSLSRKMMDRVSNQNMIYNKQKTRVDLLSIL